jgi:hypothetical protein
MHVRTLMCSVRSPWLTALQRDVMVLCTFHCIRCFQHLVRPFASAAPQ